MKLVSVKSALIALVTLLSVGFTNAEERVLATVDGYPILQSQVDRALGKRAKSEANRKTALEDVINDFLVQRAIQQSGVKVNYAYVDQMIENIAAQNGLTYGQFLDALDYQGITLNQYRQQLAHQIMMDQVRQQTIGESLQQVDPQQVESLAKQLMTTDKAKGKLNAISDTQYKISHILLKTNPILNDAQAKAKLANFVAEMNVGKISFEQVASKHSVDYASGAEGGDLGWNFLEAYDPTFAAVAKKSKTGVISTPFKSQFGWHVLKVTDTRKADRTEDAYLQRAYQQLMNQQAQVASQNWVQALKNRAEIKYLQ
ncbi:MAG: peptidylprolyl isomerase [Pasteurellaceae bacterium]|nr:peptidylprolyl isomerase [Pasteurellaceae bacterium]